MPTASPSREDIKSVTARAYNSAADTFDGSALGFWELFGSRTIQRLNLAPGMRVLDVCCGSGASALPAAQDVGPDGLVIGVDLAYELLNLARSKAADRSLGNARFRLGDMEDLGYADESFDAVVCVFGIFFSQDMPASVRELWRMVRPGGKLAITTWGPDLFEPASTIFWESVRGVRPDLHKSFNPWDQVNTPGALTSMLASAGVCPVQIEAEAHLHTLKCTEDWWEIVTGSGYRGTVDRLTEPERRQVKSDVLSALQAARTRKINAPVVYAIATKQ